MMKLELAVRGEGTLVERVVAGIAQAVAARALPPGGKLPSIRQFAAAHRISKSTVVEAYDRLVAQGLLTSKSKAGFYVAAPRAPLTIAESERPTAREIDPVWMMRQALQPGRNALLPGCGWLPEGWLDEEGLRRALRALARSPQAQLTEYGPPLGHAALRGQLQLLFAARGIEAAAGQILLTDSGSQAIDLVNRFLLRPGDAVLVDDPCYFNFQANLRVHRAKVIGIPYRRNGPDLDAFAAAAEHRPRLYITNAGPHNPTGAALAPALAHRLLKLAEEHDIAILEDDIFADFAGRPAPRLASLDQLSRVVYIGSFSKTLSAAVRCGYIAARPDWIDGLVDLKLATTFGNSSTSAQLVHRLLTDGSYRKHVEQIRHRLATSAAPLMRQLRDCGLEPWVEPEAGLFVWAQLPDGVDSAALARRALEENIVLAPGNVFSVSQAAGRFLRFNLAQSRHPRLFEFLRCNI